MNPPKAGRRGHPPEVSMKEKNGEHPFGDAGQLIFLGMFLVVWVGDSFFLRKSTFLSDYVPLYLRLIVLGLALITAIYLFRSGHVVVSREMRPDGVVVTGAFRFVRHPLYLASILTYFGLTLSTTSILSLVVLLGVLIFYNYIASYEEKLLEKKFGEEYERYKKRTGKWVPRIGRED
jgi:protein-S-isoprenylcysteine O-methyltransferase Ste14